MSSTFFQNINDIYINNKEFLKIVKVKLQRKKNLKQIEQKEQKENFNHKLLNLNFLKEINNKRTRMKRQDLDKFISNEKTIFPLLNNNHYKTLIPNSNSLNSLTNINFKTIKREKGSNFNYLYLEYKKDNKSLDDVTYIKIEPNKIITFLIDFPNIKQIFHVLTEKINKRNIISKNPNIDISDLKINIEEILYGKEKTKKNNIIDIKHNSINNKNNINNINRLNTSSSIYITEEEKNKEKNFAIFDLFLFDIINKVINKSIFLHDKRSQKIDEEFMIKEYKNQIAKLKIFFYEKINDKKITNNFIDLFQITKFNNNYITSTKKNFSPNKDINIIHKKNSNKNKLKENNNNFFEKPFKNIYKIDIGPKINIIDSNELLNKIKKQKIEIKKNSNNNDKYINKLIELNNKKIKFENIMIEEKTKLLNFNNNLIKNRSRNILNKDISRKKIFIRNKIFHECEDEIENDIKNIIGKSMNSLRKITVYDTKTNKSFSSINEKEIKKEEKTINNNDNNNIKQEKMIIEKLLTKNNFGVTKVVFNKTIDKINQMNKSNLINNKSKMKKYNFSFLNSIYGKINTKRKMKINEIDFKNEINNKGYQLLFNALQNPFLKLNKNKSAEDILSNKNNNSIDKATNTKEIIFNY